MKNKINKTRLLSATMARSCRSFTLMMSLPFISMQAIAAEDDFNQYDQFSINKQSPIESMNEDLSIIAKETGASFEQVKSAMAFQEQFSAFLEKTMQEHPNKVARVWVDSAPSQGAHIEFVGDVPALKSNFKIDAFGGAIYSAEEQDQRATHLNKLLKAHNKGNFLTYFDHKTGMIKLEMKAIDSTKAVSFTDLAAILNDDSALDTDEKSSFLKLSIDDIDYEVVEGAGEIYELEASRGGNWVRRNSTRLCTSGWSVSGPNGGGIITAAHCTGLNRLEASSSSVANMVWRSQVRGSGGDVEYHTTNQSEPAEYWANASSLRDVTGTKSTGSMSAGSTVCEYGRSSNTRTCNHEVISNNVTATFSDGVTVRKLVRVTNDESIGGDSGGPWSFNTTAWGVHSGSNGSTSLFTPVRVAQSSLNVSIKTQ